MKSIKVYDVDACNYITMKVDGCGNYKEVKRRNKVEVCRNSKVVVPKCTPVKRYICHEV